MVRRVMMIAGEVSGDVHGAGVVRELKRRQPSMEIYGIGGERMKREGMTLTYHVQELSFMGFIEVLKHLPLIRSVERTLEQLLVLKKPDVVVLIDYPGFNLRFARKVKKYGVKVVYYISPQVWAWKKGRVKKMRGIIDAMLVVFPFEEEIYRKGGIEVKFVGHPLLEELNVEFTRDQFCKRFGIDPEKKILALIPGSRPQEVQNLFSVMVRSASLLQDEENLEVIVAVAPNLHKELFSAYLPENHQLHFVENATHEIMKYAHLAIVTSGTATLETACFETPMIVVYRTSWLTYLVARALVRIKNIGLVNIVAGRSIVPELIQHNVTVQKIVELATGLLKNDAERAAMKNNLSTVKGLLGAKGASANVADVILAMSPA
ncbi:MAG: lipid-A-disaccharide synthase [Bacteroidota bacterium]